MTNNAEGSEAGQCDMVMYVHGQPFQNESGEADVSIRVQDILAMEVYVAAGSVPRAFAGANAACGVIMLWRG